MKALAIKYIGLLGILVVAACNTTEKTSEQEVERHDDHTLSLSEEQIEYIGLETVSVQKNTVFDKISVMGEVGVPPQSNVVISAIADLQILDVPRLVGEKVERGQVLARATSPMLMQWQQEFLSKKEGLKLAQQELDRQSSLHEKRINARKMYEQALTNAQKAQSEFDAARNRLEMIGLKPDQLKEGKLMQSVPIRAPISGRISEIYIHRNQFVKEGNPVFGVINTHHLHAELKVFEKGLSKVKEGQKTDIYVSALDEHFTGYIYLISNSLQRDAAYVEVHAHFEDEELIDSKNLRMGQMLEAAIFTREYEAYQVPVSAVFMIDGVYYVFIRREVHSNESHFEAFAISRGTEMKDKVNIEFLSTPPEGPFDVVSEGAFFLASKLSEGGGH